MPRKFWIENTTDPLPSIVFSVSQPPPSDDGNTFTEITDPTIIKEQYLIQYNYRIEDGKKYVKDFTTDIYIDVLNSTYTNIEAFALEAHLNELYAALNNGIWQTAQNINQNLAISGIYDTTMKAEIQSILDDYVSNNY